MGTSKSTSRPQQVVSFEVVLEVHDGPILDEHDHKLVRRDLEGVAKRLGWADVKVAADDRY